MTKAPFRATPDNAPWGLYDRKDHCWLGSETGPVVYDGVTVSFELARVAELVTNERFGCVTRIQLCRYDGHATAQKDSVTPRHTFVEALARLEATA